MNIFILICNICIPLLMIIIGLMQKHNLYKSTNKLLNLIIPISMLFSGLSDDKNTTLPENLNSYKKYGQVWTICGLLMLISSIIILLFNKSDIHSTSISIFEAECLILVIIFITIKFSMKNNKKNT
ncbi:hypothetical protein [Clostridium sp. Ade.TY]|uniref:hypothetical protein n=1 Tax=Clostridium sp. Ade.TY TaxID=1391647 RepID=UPI0004678604|nr:hypothetical protein [Clostridium sp. Ade.TY]